MNKSDYFKIAIKYGLYEHLRWYFQTFSETDESTIDDIPEDDRVPYMTLRRGNKIYYLTEGKDIEEITDSTIPLFSFKDEITVDKELYPGVEKPIKTTIGTLIANYILLYSNLGTKIPFKTPPFTIRDIEKEIVDNMKDEDDKPTEDDITIDDYLRFVEATTFLRSLSTLVVVSSTEKTITPPPNIEIVRKQIIEKYKDKLTDFSVIAEIENELKKYDAEYLKDDPTFNKFMAGKIANVARKRMFLSFGAEPDSDDASIAQYVESSLSEGWPKDPEQLTALFNTLRSGSYQRGTHTQKGGVLSKIFGRIMNVYKVGSSDCKTKRTIHWTVKEEDSDFLIGRYYMKDNKAIEITKEDFKGLVNKTIEVRSPLYCKEPGTRFCAICVGKHLARKPEGISLSAMEISGAVTTASLKAMHGKVLKNVTVKVLENLT